MGNKIILSVFHTSTYERNNDNIITSFNSTDEKQRHINRTQGGFNLTKRFERLISMYMYGALNVFVIPGESPTLGIGNEERNGVL